MKIMHTDNFAGDYPDEKFVTGLPGLNPEQLRQVCDLINSFTGPDAPRYYQVVEDDYVLQPGFEP